MSLPIIFASDEYIIINKPAGLLAHGAEHIKEPSLIEELLQEYPGVAKVGDDPSRPGLVHRLDKMVSGLMVIARTTDSFDSLKKQFQSRSIEKTYVALVYGKIDKDEGEIIFPIKRSRYGHKMAALPPTDKGEKNLLGRTAITEFWVTRRYINYTLLQVAIRTGRTHQIRVHLSAYGHPLVGDDLYATPKTKAKNQKLNLGRIFLVATRLKFADLSGEEKKYQIDLPDDLQSFLNTLK